MSTQPGHYSGHDPGQDPDHDPGHDGAEHSNPPVPSRPTAGTSHQGHPNGGRHDRHAGHSVAMFRDRFLVCLALTIPVLVWSPDLQEWLGYTAPVFPGSELIAPLRTIVFLYGGLPFLQMALPELRTRKPGMMTLISLAISVAFVYSHPTGIEG